MGRPIRTQAFRTSLELLSRAGIEVQPGVLAGPCAALNPEWNKWISTGMPYVIAKAAMTLDGRINSPPESRWITSEALAGTQ